MLELHPRGSKLDADPPHTGVKIPRLFTVEDAEALRTAVDEFERLRIEGERLAAELDCPELTAWVEDMREAGAGPRKMVASMRPILAH